MLIKIRAFLAAKIVLSMAAMALTLASAEALAQRSVSYTYNSYGQVLTIDGPRNDVTDVTTYEYDAQGNRTRMINALNQETLYTSYDPSGHLLSMTDPNGAVTNYSYDLRQRMTSYTRAAGTALAATTSLEYDPVGNLTAVIQPNGARLDYQYDAAQRLVAIEDSLGNRMEYTLDPAGNITQQDLRDPLGTLTSTQTLVYDQLSRLIETIGANMQTTRYSYDLNDNLIASEDGFLNPSSRTVDALNRITQETDRDLNTASFTYDSEDRLTSVTDQRGLITSYVYNAYGDLIEQNSPDTGITTFAYDNAGNLIQRTDARGEISNYSYDALNRLLSVSFASDASENINYSYDQGSNGIGRLSKIEDQSGQTDYSYNLLGQLIGKTSLIGSTSYSTGYDYDLAGNLTQITYASGRILDFGLDALGRVASISTRELPAAAVETVVQSVSYLPFGPAASLTYGNGISQTMGYDQDYRVSAISSQGSSGVLDRFYQYDVNNNITDVFDYQDGSKDQNFGYDNLDRLSSAAGAYGQIDYAYDPVGNRTQRMIDDGSAILTEDYSYSASANQLDQITGSAGGTRNYSYDAAGNQLSGNNPAGDTISHSYNAANRPQQASGSNGTVIYAHNALGQRVLTDNSSTLETQQYQYDEQGNLMAVSDETGSTEREYLYLGNQKIAMLVAETGVNAAVEMNLYFIHNDHLGTPQVVTNGSQSVAWQADYQPFGELDVSINQLEQDARFPGQYEDGVTGLYYNYYRDYDPSLGRYLTSDPLGIYDGPNTYAYAYQNPLTNIDPDGRLVCGGLCVTAIGIGVGFAFDAAIDAIRGSDNSGAATVANAAGGGAIAGTLPTQQKPRTGFSGGGPSGDRTSVGSQLNHKAYQEGRRSLRTRQLVTKGLRKVPYIGTGLGIAELLDALYDRYNDKDPCER